MDWQHGLIVAAGLGLGALQARRPDVFNVILAAATFGVVLLALFKKSPIAQKVTAVIKEIETETTTTVTEKKQ
jgi:uncharacterized membrane protein